MLKKLFSTVLFLGLVGGAAAADASLFEQINRAGEQRMLSQRIAKSFSQIGLNIQPFVAKQELDEASSRFEANLAFLAESNEPKVKTAVDALRAVWLPFRAAARGVPQKGSAIWLAHKSEDVLAAAETLVRDLQNSATNATRANSRLVAQAGRQRMLSQRIVKAYLLLSP